MVLITDDRDGGGSAPIKLKQIPQIKSGDALVHPAPVSQCPLLSEEDEYLGSYESEVSYDYEEYDEFSELPDTRSITSDDSFYPTDYEDEESSQALDSTAPLSFFQACSTNNATVVKVMVQQGVTEEQVRETDKNNRTGLIMACYLGYVDVVIVLAQCPFVDVNWQDNEGNTALIMASQAGHIMISSYLLNYYPGLDLERRNCHGFTALMKAAVQGRTECVRTLMLAGADLQARDNGRKLTAREWALFTGRYETTRAMSCLIAKPCPEQFSPSYRPEWPLLPELVSRATQPKGLLRKVSEALQNVLFSSAGEPLEDGVMDHMVRVTTAMGSPFVATACRTVCPDSPPCVGKRRYAVQEILRKQRAEQLKNLGPEHLDAYKKLFQNSEVAAVPKKKERTASLPPQEAAGSGPADLRRTSLMPLHMVRRRSVRPGIVVPKVRVTKAPPADHEPERARKKSAADTHLLQVPRWKYKEAKEGKKKAEEEEKKKAEAEARQRDHKPTQGRT